MATTEERVRILEERLQQFQEQHTELMGKLQQFEKNSAETTKAEIDKVIGGLRELYSKADTAIGSLSTRMQALEVWREHGRKGEVKEKSLLHEKDIKPDKLNKEDDWRQWKADVEDYAEEALTGMKDVLEKIRNSDHEINEEWFGQDHERWWGKGEMLFRFLRRYTGTEARRVIQGVSDDNGWEAWRKINQHYEPGTITREAQVMAKYTSMVNRKAKNPGRPRR